VVFCGLMAFTGVLAMVTMLAGVVLGIAPEQSATAHDHLPSLPRTRELVFAPPSRSLYQLWRPLLLNDKVRGRDQRHAWLRAVAVIHPNVRLLLMLLVIAIATAVWLSPGWKPKQCVPIQLGTLSPCRAVLAALAVAAGATTAIAAIVYEVYRGAAEELKDRSLSEELLAAAASSAAYEELATHRLGELRRRGVESGNWRVDEALSDAVVAIFYNHHEQRVVVAFRGSASLSDWSSNLRRIVPGDLESSPSIQRSDGI
jgi:disulfide bond formation protein DsbB